MKRSTAHRLLLIGSLCASVVCIAVLAGNAFASIRYSAEFSESDLSFSKEEAYDSVRFLGCLTMSDAGNPEYFGKPDLPVKLVRLMIPQGHEVTSIHIDVKEAKKLDGTFKLYPQQPPIPTREHYERPSFVEPIPSVYEKDDPYPSELVEVEHLGDYAGANRIVTLAVHPLQYYPASGRLVFHSRISFSLETTPGRQSTIKPAWRRPVSAEVVQHALRSTVDNPEDIETFGHKPAIRPHSEIGAAQKPSKTLSVNFYEYVVITSSALESDFSDFTTWMSRKGIEAGVVTTSDIYSDYTGDGDGLNDNAGEIRGYLKDAYNNHDTQWVLLAGDHSIVPVRYGWGLNNTSNDFYISPTDVYYADLTGDWEVDGDSRYGEPQDDSVDGSNLELYVGRLPCVNGTDIQNWTEKLLKYEQNPGNGSYSYLTKAFWVSADECREEPETSDDHMDGFSHTNPKYKEQPSASSPDPTAYLGADVVEEMSDHYGFLNWHCHGVPNHFNTMTSELNQPPWSKRRGVWITDSANSEESNDGLDNMTNEDYYSVVYSICCHIAAFDDYLIGQYPGRCMAEGFTVFGKKGGPALLGNTRIGYVGSSAVIQRRFYDCVFDDDDYRVGVAEANSKSSPCSHHLCLTHNLFGDPVMPLWTTTPSTFNVTMTVNANSVAVNAGVSGCTICASSYDCSSYYQVRTNVQSTTFNTSTRPLYIVVTKQDYIPYVAVTGGSLTCNQTWFGELLVHGDVSVPSGRTLTIKPDATVKFATNDGQSGGSDATKCELIVEGALDVNGTSSDKVTFTSSASTPQAGDWYGIVLEDGSSVDIDHATIAYAKYGIRNGEILYSNDLTVNNSTIRNCSHDGLRLEYWPGTATLENTTIKDNGSKGIYASSGGTLSLNADSLINNGSYHAYLSSCALQANNCVFMDNDGMAEHGIRAYNVSGAVQNTSEFSDNFVHVYVQSNNGGMTLSDTNFDLGAYHIYNSSADTVEAEDNYWGTTNPATIAGKMYGPVDWNPFEQSPVGKPILTSGWDPLPASFDLMQNFPNPFNPVTVIRYQIPRRSVKDQAKQERVALEIYNLLGQRVRRLVERTAMPGRYTVTWDSRDEEGRALASGLYFCRMQVGSFVRTTKMLLLR